MPHQTIDHSGRPRFLHVFVTYRDPLGRVLQRKDETSARGLGGGGGRKRIFWTFRSPLNLAEPHWDLNNGCRSFCRLSRAERGRGWGSGVEEEEESFNSGESKISHPKEKKNPKKVWGCDLCRGRRSAVCDMHAGHINAYARLAALRVVDIQWSVGSCLHFSLGGTIHTRHPGQQMLLANP